MTGPSDDMAAQLRRCRAENKRLRAELERLKAAHSPEAVSRRIVAALRDVRLRPLPTREEFDARLDREIRELLEGGGDEPDPGLG